MATIRVFAFVLLSLLLGVILAGCGATAPASSGEAPGASATLPAVANGAGLGMAIAADIATAHGGAIDVTSAPQVGTTFVVTLPRG